jgi:class 3 adenylate cyclase
MHAKGPRATVDVVNSYFDAATGIISKHSGVVAQFQGDGLLAVFNVPVENEQHAQCAFFAAIEILARVRDGRFSGERLAVRIGLNTGSLIAGIVGGGGRQSYTVYGDTVNLAARLEALNKQYDTSLLMSHSTAALLSDANLKKVDETRIRGFSTSVGIYTLAHW